MKGGLEIIEPGMLMSIQDGGRFGYRKYGVPVSGALDAHAYRVSNWLVNNDPGEPVIEMTLQGGRFKFHQPASVAITGAKCEVLINGEKSHINTTHFLKDGDELAVERAQAGCRSYLAVGGNWMLEKYMGSYSTCLAAGFGGLNGRKLQKQDRLYWSDSRPETNGRTIPKKLVPHFGRKQIIRITKGPEWEEFSQDQHSALLNSRYHISSESNRMGIRLKGSRISDFEYPEMKSAPVIPGIIQVPKSGDPIILMHDSQSVGGYPRVAKVIDADLWRVAQLWTGNEIQFKQINHDESIQLSSYFDNLLNQIDPS